jgi:murein L,D-transpeptidase YcbB/YkuD
MAYLVWGVDRRRLLSLIAVSAALPAACGQSSAPESAPPPAPPPPEPTLKPGQGEALLQALGDAPSHGFKQSAFKTDDIAAQVRAGDAGAGKLLLGRAAGYARALHGLSIPENRMPPAWSIRPPPYDAVAELRSALEQDRLKDWLDSLPPSSDRYQALRAAYQDSVKADDGHAEQLRANLERERWLPRSQPPTRIEVNSAADTFDLYSGGTVEMHMLAAAGRPGDETPMLTSAIDSIVFNPAWHVPPSIARKELFPRARRDRGYLYRHGYSVHSTRIVQPPGPHNALGRVKFDFPNPFAVYLHDTPTKSVFTQTNRAVSHGCVRLERALDLAQRLLSEDPGWSEERIDKILATRRTVRIELPQPVTLGIYYFTAVPVDGQITYLDDIYGWDDTLLRLLDAATSSTA